MPQDSSELGFERDRRIATKLGRTLLLLVLGGFFLIFTALVFAPGWNRWCQVLAELAIEVCWSFWVLALLFVWWKPHWLRMIYLHSEMRMLRLAKFLKWAGIILFVIAILFTMILFQIGVLPVNPKLP
jgi:hypothetical protein